MSRMAGKQKTRKNDLQTALKVCWDFHCTVVLFVN